MQERAHCQKCGIPTENPDGSWGFSIIGSADAMNYFEGQWNDIVETERRQYLIDGMMNIHRRQCQFLKVSLLSAAVVLGGILIASILGYFVLAQLFVYGLGIMVAITLAWIIPRVFKECSGMIKEVAA